MQTMKHRKSSKIISLLLVMVLLCAMFPIRIFAEETGEVTVSTAKDFIQAVNSNNAWKITLADDVVIEYGMTNSQGNWNSNYQSTAQPGFSGQPQGILVGNKANAGGSGSFVIDGQNQYKIIFKWPHTIVENGNFYFPNASKVNSFTMKDITWYGSSEVGCYFPAGNVMNDVQITFDHVTYKGPGMGDIAIYPVYKPQVLFRDCDITMSYRNGSGGSGVDSDGYGGSLPSSGSASYGALWQDTHASETIAANFITFEGNNTIAKQDSPADGGGVLGDIDPIFYIYWY
ncbi:MAG: pectate lyase-like adhesive domain-containing protein, partial [Lacrimispora sphenoides]